MASFSESNCEHTAGHHPKRKVSSQTHAAKDISPISSAPRSTNAGISAHSTPLKSPMNVSSQKSTSRKEHQSTSPRNPCPVSMAELPSSPIEQCIHRSEPTKLITYQSTGGPPPTPIVVSEVLCFIQNFASRCSKVTLVSVMSGFYTTEEIITAKNRLFEFALTIEPKLIGVENKNRRGAQKRTKDTEDIIDLFLLLDRLNVPMPRYGAAKIDRIPSFRPAEPDVDDIIDSLGGLGFDTDDIASLTSKQAQVAALTQKVKSVSDKVDSILATQNIGTGNVSITAPTNNSSHCCNCSHNHECESPVVRSTANDSEPRKARKCGICREEGATSPLSNLFFNGTIQTQPSNFATGTNNRLLNLPATQERSVLKDSLQLDMPTGYRSSSRDL